MRIHFETFAGDRYMPKHSMNDEEVRHWLLVLQKQDILKAEEVDVEDGGYWEDLPENLFRLIKSNIDSGYYEYSVSQGHLFVDMLIDDENLNSTQPDNSDEPTSTDNSQPEPEPEPEPEPPQTDTVDEKTSESSGDDPLQILKQRFARGEISSDEYEKMKNVLES